MEAGTHICTMTDHENDGFHQRNLNSTKPISTYDKNGAFGRPHSFWVKHRKSNLTTSKIWLQKCTTIRGIPTLCKFRHIKFIPVCIQMLQNLSPLCSC